MSRDLEDFIVLREQLMTESDGNERRQLKSLMDSAWRRLGPDDRDYVDTMPGDEIDELDFETPS